MTANPDEMRFSSASIDLLKRVKYAAYRHAADRSLEHAMRSGREVVSEDDVVAVLRAALEEAVAQEVPSRNAQPTPPLATVAAG